MDMNLQISARAEDALVASYTCPCGCNPGVEYVKGGDHAVEGCCCGNTFAVGPDAGRHLQPADGFVLQVDSFRSPWGQALDAAWMVGPSRHADDDGHEEHGHEAHGHEDHGHEVAQSARGTAVDPVCGMTVDVAAATTSDLHLHHDGTEYYFCGRGCKLEFGDDPHRYLDPAYVASM